MNREKRFKSVPIRSKTGLAIRITRRDTNFDQEAKIPVKQTQISTIRSQKSSAKQTKEIENEQSYSFKKTKNTPRSETELLKNQTLINLRKQLLETHDFTDISTKRLNQLSTHLRLYSTDCILNRDYDEAEICDDLAIEIKEEICNRENSLLDTNYQEDHEADMHNHLDKYIAELDAFDEQTIQRREELEKKQENEFYDFENKWKTEYPKKYRKPSTKLLLMIENERRVGLQGNYKLAREMKAQTDEQRRIEVENAQERLNNDYLTAREKLLEKQMHEREQFDQTRSDNRQLLIKKQEHELNSTVNRELVLSLKEQQQYKMKKNFNYSESKANTAQLLKKGKDAEILLPPLTPPDYKSIKQAEAEKAKIQAKKSKETEEKLAARKEHRRKEFERLSQQSSPQRIHSPDSHKETKSVNSSDSNYKQEEDFKETKQSPQHKTTKPSTLIIDTLNMKDEDNNESSDSSSNGAQSSLLLKEEIRQILAQHQEQVSKENKNNNKKDEEKKEEKEQKKEDTNKTSPNKSINKEQKEQESNQEQKEQKPKYELSLRKIMQQEIIKKEEKPQEQSDIKQQKPKRLHVSFEEQFTPGYDPKKKSQQQQQQNPQIRPQNIPTIKKTITAPQKQPIPQNNQVKRDDDDYSYYSDDYYYSDS